MSEEHRSASVDRIEDGKFAVLHTDDGRELVVPVEDIPIPVEGGTWIQFREQDGRLIDVTIDEEKQAEVRARISGKVDRLRRRGRNR